MDNAVDDPEANEEASDVEVRRSSRPRKLPQSKFSDMQVTYPVIKTSHTKPAMPTAEMINKGNPIKRKKRSSKTDLWLHRPKNTKTASEVLYDATELGPKDVAPVQIKDLSTIPVLSEEEVACVDPVVVIPSDAVMSAEALQIIYENVILIQPHKDMVASESDIPVLNHEEVIESNLTESVLDPPESDQPSSSVEETAAVPNVDNDEAVASITVDTQGAEITLSEHPDSSGIQERNLGEGCTSEEVANENTLYQVQMPDGNVVIVRNIQVLAKDAQQIAHEKEEEPNTTELRCKECPYKTDKQPYLKKHLASHRKATYVCDQCSFKCSSSSNLLRHKQTHSNEKKYKCSHCNQAFRQKAHLDRHIKSQHTVKCPECSFVCDGRFPGFSAHMKETHGTVLRETGKEKNGDQVFCEECNFGPASKKGIGQHMKLHRAGTEMKFFCEQCSFLTHNKSRLERHMLVHSGEKPFACGQCNYQSTQKAHVLRHMRNKHGIAVSPQRKPPRIPRNPSADSTKPAGSVCPKEKHFLCNFCTMTFTKLINLRKHVMVQHAGLYTPDKPGQYSCVMCNYITGHWNNLLVHMRKHSFQTVKEGCNLAFTCVLCPFSCSSRNLLHEHMNTEHQVNVDNEEDKLQESPTKDSPCVKVQLAPGAQYSTVHIESPPPAKEEYSIGGSYVELNGDMYLVTSVEMNNADIA